MMSQNVIEKMNQEEAEKEEKGIKNNKKSQLAAERRI
jgi:hypothetical protein